MTSGTKITSKIAGAGKGAIKALEGYSGIFHHLAGEHAEVSVLMKRVAGTSDTEEREKIFPEIRRSLLAHARGEEEEFYPELRKYPELAASVERSLAEHKQIEMHLGRLETGNASTPQWIDQFKQLVSAVELHVDHEEKDLFPKANDLLESQRAREIEDRYEKVEEREKERL